MPAAHTTERPLALDELVAHQRRAILARDASALELANEALLAGIAALRAGVDASSRQVLQRAQAGLRVNAELLQRAQAGNSRALSAIFGRETVYRGDGDGRVARASRPLDCA